MKILAIDPAYSHFGWCVLKGKHLLAYGSDQIEKKKESKKLLFLHARMIELCISFNPSIVAIEDICYCRNALTFKKQAYAQGVFMLAAAQQQVEVSKVNNTAAKKAAAGSGRASKEEVRIAICERFGIADNLHSDVYDAVAVGLAARNV